MGHLETTNRIQNLPTLVTEISERPTNEDRDRTHNRQGRALHNPFAQASAGHKETAQ